MPARPEGTARRLFAPGVGTPAELKFSQRSPFHYCEASLVELAELVNARVRASLTKHNNVNINSYCRGLLALAGRT